MPADIFATKGIEYLLVIVFLAALVVFWRLLARMPAPALARAGRSVESAAGRWFELRSERLYHQGHTWVDRERPDVVRVGVDDFARRLIGAPQRVDLPRPGTRLRPGERGFRLIAGGKAIDVLSPVAGRVVERNEEVRRTPALVDDDPYDRGWLVKVRLSNPKAALSNLLSGKLAVDWMEQSATALRERMTGRVGPVLQDGGVPVSGIARELSEGEWERVAREFLLTD